jgi:predicted TIM-barrel fold metal-dependent hydrolase
MPLQDYMQLISVDDHIIEPRNVWLDRLPSRYHESAPHVEETELDHGVQLGAHVQGRHEVWVYEGRAYPAIGLNAVAGKDPHQYTPEPIRYSDMIPGCYDPVERVRDMDLDGIQAQLCFPTFPRFAGTRFLEANDKDLGLLCVRAWNDWQLEEWCATAPERFIPMCILPLWDPSAAADEIRRMAALGAHAVSFPENPYPLGLPSYHTDHWDPVFRAAEECGLPLCIHFGTSGVTQLPSPDSPIAIPIILQSCNSMSAVTDMLFSPMFVKFPDLHVAISEGGIGWIPYLLERSDFVWDRVRQWANLANADHRPSDVFRKNFWGCFIDDDAGLAARDSIGTGRIMWECDYPHHDSHWPHSRRRAATMMQTVPDPDAHAIVELNARRLFNFWLGSDPARSDGE